MGKAWEHSSHEGRLVDTRWTLGGGGGWGGAGGGGGGGGGGGTFKQHTGSSVRVFYRTFRLATDLSMIETTPPDQ